LQALVDIKINSSLFDTRKKIEQHSTLVFSVERKIQRRGGSKLKRRLRRTKIEDE